MASFPTARATVGLGILMGVVFGGWDLYQTWTTPLLDDSVPALLRFYGPMVFAWGVVGFLDHRSRGSLIHAVASGAVVALVTFAVFYCAILLRINLFLEVLRSRDDWTRLVALFPSSGFQSFRAFANYDYAVGAPLKLVVATMIGAVTGLAGGLFSTVVDLTLGSRNSN
jgi:hypothetical protein